MVPALLAMLDSPVAALRAKALVSFALLTQTHLVLLLDAFQAKLSPQVVCPRPHSVEATMFCSSDLLLQRCSAQLTGC